MRHASVPVLMLLVSLVAVPAGAEQYILKEYSDPAYTYATVADAKLYGNNNTYKQYAYGGLETIYVYDAAYPSLIRFDFSAIPNAEKIALVNSATLRLYRTAANGNSTITVGQLAQDWVEGTAKGNGGDTCDGVMWFTRNAGTWVPKASLVSAGTNLWTVSGAFGIADDPATAGKKHIRPNSTIYGNSNTGTGMSYTHCDTLAALQALPTSTRAYYYDAAAGIVYLNKNDYGIRYYTPLDYWTTPGGTVTGSTINYTIAPAAPAWVEWNVAPIVRNWLVSHQANYGLRIAGGYTTGGTFASSEYVTDPTKRPELVLDVTYYDLPGTPGDLAAGNPDWNRLDLTWTAPSSNPPGPVGSYDIRYSTSLISNDADFEAATQCTGEPAGMAPGQAQTFTVTGLEPDTTYYFALKAIDSVGQISAMSNVTSGHTHPRDAVAPAGITDLAAGEIKPIRATLSWTAPADDGIDPASGLASRYEMRYSTSELTEATWSSATLASGLPAPQAAGSAEAFLLRNLTPETAYYVAIKTADEASNVSTISNVASVTTPPLPTSAPLAVADLQVEGTHIHSAVLIWTAPATPLNATLARYDIRYSTGEIHDGNFDAATQVTGEPVPSPIGGAERFVIGGLTADTVYYFAIKTADESEPALVSPLSNVPSARTKPAIVPVTVHNPWLANDRVADCRTLQTMAATFDKAYTPDGVIVPSPTDIETRAINSYNNFKRRCYHWGEMPTDSDDVVEQLNIFGWALCGSEAAMNAAILQTMGLHPRTISIASGGHTYYEVQYNGKWHALDTMTTFYVYDRNTPRSLACMADIKADKNLVYNAVAEGRACPGFLLCGDTPDYFANGSDTWSVKADPGVGPTDQSMNMDLRLGEGLKRTCESWITQHTNTNAPFHHESQHDWKESVNILYWEPYTLNTAQNAAINISKSATYRRWANGTYDLKPDFQSAGYQASLLSSANIATFNDDGLSPDLHAAAVGSPASAVFQITTPFYLTDLNISGTFFKNGLSDVNRLYVSNNGTTYTKIWDNTTSGTTELSNLNARTLVYGKRQVWVKVELQAIVAKTDAGVSNLVITPTFEHNKGGMAYLDKGTNNLTLTFDNSAELQASHNVMHVVYQWKEHDGTGWNVDRQYEGWFGVSPSTFTIVTDGTKVPRTESVLMEVVPAPYDPAPPAAIADLALGGVTGSARIPLSWTATGDDGSMGTAMAYDLRYSTTPIIDDTTFAAATRVAGVPAPKPAGSPESFVVRGLTPSTTYYFAIKALDKGTNTSPLSNIASPTTAAPAQVSDLAAGTSGSARVPLTWTAIDDGNTGTAASYDLRYSTSEITDDASFDAAAPVSGLPAPKAPGGAESFTVLYLQPGTTYYFAIKAVDGAGNRTLLSNVVSATTTAAAHIGDLAVAATGFNKVSLTWIAIDEGSLGQAASYDLRYSTSAITDDASFSAATQVTGEPAPKPAGGAETFLVTGLSPLTTYWFAVKAIDAHGTACPLSNVATTTTAEPDTVRPQWVGDLKGKPSQAAKGVNLTWTAPADYGANGSGPFACVSYDLRYSTSPIDETTFATATAVTGLAAPKGPGQAEALTVMLPDGNTTYYFAIKCTDEGVPANVSEISNCAPARSSLYGETVLQDGLSGYAGTRDSFIAGTSSTTWNSDRLTVTGYVSYTGGIANIQRSFVRFDLASLPADMVVRQATFSLYAWDAAGRKGNTGFYGIYAMTRDWNETQIDWNEAATGSLWTTPGGDFLATADGTSPKQGVVNVWYPFDATARVQAWLADPASNFGWVIRCTDEDLLNQDRFYSGDNSASSATLRPKLVVSDLPVEIVGDITSDEHVDVIDLLTLADSWGLNPGQRGYDPRCDFNSDGTVDLIDLLTLAGNWGR